MSLRHRNSLTECSLFFVTTTVVKFLNVFTDNRACDLLIEQIGHYQKQYSFDILGYVIMPSHFHWIVKVDSTIATISDIMRNVKKHSAWRIMEYLTANKYDDIKVFAKSARLINDQKRKFWMPRFHDEVIRNEKMFWAKLKYIHDNPVKAGLAERITGYKYSSARNYVNGDHSVIEVDTEYAGIQIT